MVQIRYCGSKKFTKNLKDTFLVVFMQEEYQKKDKKLYTECVLLTWKKLLIECQEK